MASTRLVDKGVSSFAPSRLAKIRDLEEWHFWFAGRRVIVDRLVSKLAPGGGRALDLGGGTGSHARRLAKSGFRVVCLDLLAGPDASEGVHPVVGDGTALPLASGMFDLVLALDVLEHVPDDGRMLSEIGRVMAPGAGLVISVPSGPSLWSRRDEDAGHARRYRAGQLPALLREHGFRLARTHHYQCLLFPALATARVMGRASPRVARAEEQPGRILNKALTRLNVWEARVGEKVAWPWGTSLIAGCTKTP